MFGPGMVLSLCTKSRSPSQKESYALQATLKKAYQILVCLVLPVQKAVLLELHALEAVAP